MVEPAFTTTILGISIGFSLLATCFPSPDAVPIIFRLIIALFAVNSPVLPCQNLLIKLPVLSTASFDSAVILIVASWS